MGSALSSAVNREEEPDTRGNQGVVFRYPPKPGTHFFANHFIMGGEKFDSPEPESFLFGENSDLNFLGSKPMPFPYPPPQSNEPTKTLRSLVNIRRDSLHFVLVPDDGSSPPLPMVEEINEPPVPQYAEGYEDDDSDTDVDETTNVRRKDKKEGLIAKREALAKSAKIRNRKRYTIQFTFDCDVDCSVTIYYFCTEEITANAAVYTPVKQGLRSETYYYTRGAGKVFSQSDHIFHPGAHVHEPNSLGMINPETGVIPVVIQCLALDGETPRQSHTTLAVVETTSDGTGYLLKPLKQKLFVDGLSYLLQEVYGLENKSSDSMEFDDEVDDSGSDCVVCMSELRDTIILPCRHLCLCFTCADSLRFQASNCPICRAPFRALLQIRVVQRVSHTPHPALAGQEMAPQEGVPLGYTPISLVDALNGPAVACSPAPVTTLPAGRAGKKSKSKKRAATGGGAKHRSKNNYQEEGCEVSDHPRPGGVFSTSMNGTTNGTASSQDLVEETGDAAIAEKQQDVAEEELSKIATGEKLPSPVQEEARITKSKSESHDEMSVQSERGSLGGGETLPYRETAFDVDEANPDEEANLEEDVIVVDLRGEARKQSFLSIPSSRSTRSSQDSNSSTKQLLAGKAGEERKKDPSTSGVKIVPASAATVVDVAPSDTEEHIC